MIEDVGDPAPDEKPITMAVERAGINLTDTAKFNALSTMRKSLRNRETQCKLMVVHSGACIR